VRSMYDTERRRSKLAGPRIAEIQTVDRCNGACPVCPYSNAHVSGAPNYMSEELYLRIVDGLSRAGSLSMLFLMFQNEPLLDPNLGTRVRQARQRLGPGVLIRVVTNGSLLDRRRAKELLAAGVSSISVSIDAVHEETYRRVRPGLDFARVVSNTQRLIRLAPRGVVEARFLRQRANVAESEEFVRFWRSQGATTWVLGMTNRAGSLERFSELRAPTPLVQPIQDSGSPGQHAPCLFSPITFLNVLQDGRVVLCCHDWSHEHLLGDLSKQSLEELWQSDEINRVRHLIWEGRYSEIPGCSRCSLVGKVEA